MLRNGSKLRVFTCANNVYKPALRRRRRGEGNVSFSSPFLPTPFFFFFALALFSRGRKNEFASRPLETRSSPATLCLFECSILHIDPTTKYDVGFSVFRFSIFWLLYFHFLVFVSIFFVFVFHFLVYVFSFFTFFVFIFLLFISFFSFLLFVF